MKNFLLVATGMAAGSILTVVVLINVFPSMMIETKESRYSLDKTVEMIDMNSIEQGWAVVKVWDLGRRIAGAGYDDAPRVKVMELCHAENTYNVLKNEDDMFVSAIMPCRMAVFEKENGKTFVSRMNIGLMSRFFSDNVRNVMKGVAEDDQRMLENIIGE
ncbi:MAG: DUF302 domain-containing protein [Candidatus Delongbacteria bacterium]